VEVGEIDGKAVAAAGLHPIKRSPIQNDTKSIFISGQDTINALPFYPVPYILEYFGCACLT